MEMYRFIKMKKILIVIIILCVTPVFSQRNLEKGDRYFNINQFESAIKYYTMDLTSKNKKAAEKSAQKLADCYRIIGEFEKAEELYRKILKRKKKDPIHYLNYALSLKSSAKYAEAKLQFEEYIKLKPEDLMGPVYLQSCDSAQKWLDETIGKEVKSIDKINTEYSEFSPSIYNHKLYFSSSRPGSKQALISFDGGGEVHRLDIYNIDFSRIDVKEDIKTDIINFKEINSPKHEGAICFSKDGKELYFTKTVKGNRNEKTNDILNTLQIFYSKIDSTGKWTEPKSAFSFNSINYSVAHPSLSPDGNTIFFMSDMKNGFGKTDIYYCIKQTNGKWSPPRNIGNSINTFGYEMFPFISESGILYFSSNAHPGMGQLDVFEASLVDGKWTNVKNVKPPINSIGNDFGIVLDGLNHHGFFSSDRFNGKGLEDIYSFADEQPITLNFENDTLYFRDKSIFDEVKYKITNEKDKSEVELLAVNGVFKVKVEKMTPYKMVARKNGMLFNKIFFEYNHQQTIYDLKLKVTTKPILLDGLFNFSKSTNDKETNLTITDSTGLESKHQIRSFYSICDTIKINQNYQITTKKLTEALNLSDNKVFDDRTIHLKIKVFSSNLSLENTLVVIKEQDKIITTLNNSTNGEFNCYLKYNYPKKYSIEISSDGFTTKNIEFETKENQYADILEVELISK